MARAVSFGEVADEAKALVSRHGGLLMAVGAAIMALYSGLDWMDRQNSDPVGNLVLFLIVSLTLTLFIQYLVVEELLADRGAPARARGQRRYFSLFGALFVSGLAIIGASLLLILPGVYLAARWMTVSQQVVENRLPALEALTASWVQSEPSQGAFIAAFLVGLSPTMLSFLLHFVPGSFGLEFDSWEALLAINFLTALSTVAGWVLATAAYRIASPADHLVHGVFD